MREDFECWFVDYYGGLRGVTNYASPVTFPPREAWKASRESMKAIKLPEELTPEYEGDGYKSRYEEAYCKGYNQALRDCEKQITSAGYEVD